VLHATALTLLDQFDEAGPFRLVGMAAYDLEPVAEPAQLDIFADGARQRRLETVIDSLTARFGRDAVRRATRLIDPDYAGPNLDYLDHEDKHED
jgi:DNA polymerase-4